MGEIGIFYFLQHFLLVTEVYTPTVCVSFVRSFLVPTGFSQDEIEALNSSFDLRA